VVHPGAFFYPLDRVQRWSRLYGRRGMTQHQCVLPGAGADEVGAFLETLRRAGGRPFLVVLKDFGAEGCGLLSFPRPGLTVTFDFAVDAGTPALVAALNRHVREVGGRVYLAKDVFSTAADFAPMEGERLARFQQVRRRWDPEGRLRSRLSTRLLGDAAAVVEGVAA
jgi:FAD/FMN-containing dehydrogenase